MSDVYDELSIWPAGPDGFSIVEGGYGGKTLAYVTKTEHTTGDELARLSRTLRAALDKR